MGLEFIWDHAASVVIFAAQDYPDFLNNNSRPKGYRLQYCGSDRRFKTLSVVPIIEDQPCLIAVIRLPNDAMCLEALPIYGPGAVRQEDSQETDYLSVDLSRDTPSGRGIINSIWAVNIDNDPVILEISEDDGDYDIEVNDFIEGMAEDKDIRMPVAFSPRGGRFLYPATSRVRTTSGPPLQIRIEKIENWEPKVEFGPVSQLKSLINHTTGWQIQISINPADVPAGQNILLKCQHYVAGNHVVEFLRQTAKKDDQIHPDPGQIDSVGPSHPDTMNQDYSRETFTQTSIIKQHERGPCNFEVPQEGGDGIPIGFMDRIVIESIPPTRFELFLGNSGRADETSDGGLAVIVALEPGVFHIDNGAFRGAMLKREALQEGGGNQYHWISDINSFKTFFNSGKSETLAVTAYAYCEFFAHTHRRELGLNGLLPHTLADFIRHPSHFQLLRQKEYSMAIRHLELQINEENSYEWLFELCVERLSKCSNNNSTEWFTQFKNNPWKLAELALSVDDYKRAHDLNIDFENKPVDTILHTINDNLQDLEHYYTNQQVLESWGLLSQNSTSTRTLAQITIDYEFSDRLFRELQSLIDTIACGINFLTVNSATVDDISKYLSDDKIDEIINQRNGSSSDISKLASSYFEWLKLAIESNFEFEISSLSDHTGVEIDETQLISRIAGTFARQINTECYHTEQTARGCGYSIEIQQMSSGDESDKVITDRIWKLTPLDGRGKSSDDIDTVTKRGINREYLYGFSNKIVASLKVALEKNA